MTPLKVPTYTRICLKYRNLALKSHNPFVSINLYSQEDEHTRAGRYEPGASFLGKNEDLS